MSQIIALVTRAAANKHTSAAGLVWMACKLGAIWFPGFKSQFEATEAVAVGYGLFMAGDAKQSAQAQSKTTDATQPKP